MSAFYYSVVIPSWNYITVNTYADLPAAAAHNGEVYVVKTTTGSMLWWPTWYKKGLYLSNGVSWNWLSEIPASFPSDSFEIYNAGNNTKLLIFNTDAITAGNTRTITMPDSDVTLGNIPVVPGFETSTSNIKMNGSVSVGALSTVPRADHIHASDTSRAADSDVFHKATSSEISALTHKSSPVNGDFLVIEDSAASNAKKYINLSDIPATQRIVSIKIDLDATVLVTGSPRITFTIPKQLNGLSLIYCAASVTTVSSSGLPTIMLNNASTTHDMLSTALTIDANEYSSETAATPAVINASYKQVSTDDRININVTGAGTGAKGLQVNMVFQ